MAIEVDGSIHDVDKIMQNDKMRQDLLEKDELTVLRFSNEQVERELEQVIKCIEDFISKRKDE